MRDVLSPTVLFMCPHPLALALIQASAILHTYTQLKEPFGAASLSLGELGDLCNTNSCFSASTSRNWQEKLALTERRKLEEAEKLKVMRMGRYLTKIFKLDTPVFCSCF